MSLSHKIPLPLGIAILAVVIGSVIFAGEKISSLAKARTYTPPAHIQITNLSDTAFTILWTTSEPSTGTITLVDPANNKKTLYDDRDTDGKAKKYTTHSVTARGLLPNTNYTITLVVNGSQTTSAASINPIHTFPSLSTKPGTLEPAFGTLTTTKNTPASGAIVTLTLSGSQTFSTLVKPSGSWIIPLSMMRTESGNNYITSVDRQTETLMAWTGAEEAHATTDTLTDGPVPAMVLGKSYDFRKTNADTHTSLLGQQQTSPSSVLGATTQPSTLPFALVQPKHGSALATDLPLIQGTGIPGKPLTITLGITQPQSVSMTIPNDGIWRYTPTKPLGIGKQNVTVTSEDINRRPVALTHSFSVLKSGTQVLGDATPSATLAPTLSPTPILETPTPTIMETPPETGSFEPLYFVLAAGIIFLLGGSILYAP